MHVEHYSPAPSTDELLKQWGKSGFGARRIADAANVCGEMISDTDCTVFLGIAGALVPAGMRQLFVDIIRAGWVDVVVTTGAAITHDLVEAFGGRHELGSAEADDKKLHGKNMNRIYDVNMPNKVYELLEDNLSKILPNLPEKSYSIKEFLFEFGKQVKDENSILRTCADTETPLFSPALADSGFGMQLEVWGEQNKLDIQALKDLQDIRNLAWDSKKAGVILLGGGTPKNYIMQAMQFSPNSASYAVQITTDKVECGGLSGCSLDEAISWGKVAESAKFVDVRCDATVAFPLIISALKQRLK